MAGKRNPDTGLTKMQEEFCHWLLLTRAEKRLHGLPLSKQEWAEWKGISTRTPRRWEKEAPFATYLEQLRIQKARALTPGSTVTPEDVGGARAATDARVTRRLAEAAEARPLTEADDPYAGIDDLRYRAYLEAKDALLAGVRNGEKGSIEMFFKMFGQDFLEAERAGGERLVDLDDDELVDELVGLLGAERIAAHLAKAVVG